MSKIYRVQPGLGNYSKPTVVEEDLDQKNDPITAQALSFWEEVYLPKGSIIGTAADVYKLVGGAGAFMGVMAIIANSPYWLLAALATTCIIGLYLYWGWEVLGRLPNGWLWLGVRWACITIAIVIMFQ